MKNILIAVLIVFAVLMAGCTQASGPGKTGSQKTEPGTLESSESMKSSSGASDVGSNVGFGTLLMQITDKPKLNVEKVLVTISAVEVHMAGSDEEGNGTNMSNKTGNQTGNKTAGWFTVVKQSKTFDLIAIQNVTEFLGDANLTAGKYTQIRLDIEKASVTIGGVDHDLKVPSEKLKLIHPFDIKENQTTTLVLDFDAQESIHAAGDKYILKPTIKIIQK